MLEKHIEQAACDKIYKQLGVVNVKLEMIHDSGWPDRLFLLREGRHLYIEFKQPGEPLRPRQEYIHAFLKQNGYDVEVCYSVEQAYKAVQARLAPTRLPEAGHKVRP